MAVIKTQNIGTIGFNLSGLDVTDLFDYGGASLTKTSAKFYDDSKNYTLLTGTNFKYVQKSGALSDVSSGTITGAKVVVSGVTVLSVKELSISAARLFDYYVAGDEKGALNYILRADDSITGTKYRDTLYGASGHDTIVGANGNDTIRGGYGNDVLKGDAGNDTINGDSGNDKSYGGVGADTIRGGYGDDLIYGEDGNDKLYGDSNNDKIYGGAGNDELSGGYGNDQLYGAAGADILYGGAHADRFIFKSTSDSTVASAGRDTIKDFRPSHDLIDLKSIDADKISNGDQAFAFKGSAAFSKVAGELIYEVLDGNAYVKGDTDGDGSADFSIRLDAVKVLEAGDFVL